MRIVYYGKPTSASRSAFTLIELLVVFSIVAVLLGLLLPAVQMAGEAARWMQCASNWKQLSLAVHGYHDAHRMLPISIGPWRARRLNWSPSDSW